MSQAGIIIAGGNSTRYGQPKAFALHHNKPFYYYSVKAIEPLVKGITIVTKDLYIDNFNDYKGKSETITDLAPYIGLGPLSGIYSGMSNIIAEWYLVAPIDVPFIKKEVYERLMEKRNEFPQAIVPIVNGRSQPLLSIYHRSVFPIIEKQLKAEELSLHSLLKLIDVRKVTFDEEKTFINVNDKKTHRMYRE
ncbi:molybdenum cofactor guanylyltransferase [Saliterribacillus persicus]|uniref:Probable molybdenum cofactor guanylyltransferase n=1 Tax=Saliterribacillus persicus TaxID=930114 RepID=A0A368XG28_9BACI|nr:molybdenum cofactor guanylyltransferase [Saliterribacillus persicus]RCW66951.1 molybdenum cofactor guanylyltransferase [Saliterribacillus persicus]